MNNIENMIKALFNKELAEKPTFSEDIQKQIQEELQRLIDEYNTYVENNKPVE